MNIVTITTIVIVVLTIHINLVNRAIHVILVVMRSVVETSHSVFYYAPVQPLTQWNCIFTVYSKAQLPLTNYVTRAFVLHSISVLKSLTIMLYLC